MTTPNLRVIIFLCVLTMFTNCGKAQTEQPQQANLDTKIGQLLCIGFRGTSVNDTSHIVRDIKKYHLGGVILYDYDVPADTSVRNVQSPSQLNNLVQQLKSLSEKSLLVSIDQEGGNVSRLKEKHGFPESVSAEYLGKINNADSSKYYARRAAQTLSNAGINMNFAPVVDLNVNTDNPVIGKLNRSYSADPTVVTEQSKILINALHRNNILSVLKHFPGHGSSKKDSHLGVVDVSDTWSSKELEPYRSLINNQMIDAIMTAHIFNAQIDSEYPATLSKPTINGVLRDSLEFDGVVISDDLMMGAIRKEYGLKETIKRSLLAGVDILMFSNNFTYDSNIMPKAHRIIKTLIKEGEISRERIDASYQRIMEMKSDIK